MGRLMGRRGPTLGAAIVIALVVVTATTVALDTRATRPVASMTPSEQPTGDPAATGVVAGAEASSGGGVAVPSPTRSSGASMLPIPSSTSPAASSPTPSAGEAGASPGLAPSAKPGPFAMDLYRAGDFATEMTPIWCAPAAMQTMINIMSRGADTSRVTQKLLYRIARRLGPAPDRGAEPEGEARTLESLQYGSFRVLALPSRAAAVKAAVRAIRLTGRPAALLVWRGAHNWVVSGFRATADPALTDDFRVTALRIEDVWYPRISDIWGASRPPDALVPVSALPQDYLPWKRPTGRYPGKDGRFVLIVPVGG